MKTSFLNYLLGTKINKLIFVLFISLTLILSSCDNSSESVLDEESLKTKIGQMIMVGFRGVEASNESSIVNDIELNNIGGIVLYDKDVSLGYAERNIRNANQVKSLISNLQSFANVKLLVAIDQEGGRVARLKEEYGFLPTVSQEYLGNLDNEDSTRFYAARIAAELEYLGINLNFAPVVDLNINPDSPAIGRIGRSFGRESQLVVNHSGIVIEEHGKVNILNAIKHFPGHGSATSDSHVGFTDVTTTWLEEELTPYRLLIEDGVVDMVMTSHVFNAGIDTEYPATLSQNTLAKLRDEINFNGVIITDDMNMGAITDNYGLETAIEKSILAGVDILLFANNLIYDPDIASKAITIIYDLVQNGTIDSDRIDDSYRRILNLKMKI